MESLIADEFRNADFLLQQSISLNTNTYQWMLTEQHHRLRLWAGNIAAHQKGPRSLDHRLREANSVHKVVIGILQSIVVCLGHIHDILSGIRQPYDEAEEEGLDDGNGDFCDEDSTVLEEFLNDSEGSASEELEMPLRISHLKDCITRLNTLSATIRKTIGRDLILKSRHIDVSMFQKYDLQHVYSTFPYANPTVIERLGRAITLRRRILKYLREENSRMKKGVDPDEGDGRMGDEMLTNLAPTSPRKPETPSVVFTQRISTLSNSVIFTDARTAPMTLTQTEATAYQEMPEVPEQDNDVEDARSDATSFCSNSELDDNLRIPHPVGDYDREPFECQLCFRMLSNIKNFRDWRQHIFEDIRPYCCTWEHCTSGGKLYGRKSEWIQHEMSYHRREWFCKPCGYLSSSDSGMRDHFQERHTDIFDSRNIDNMISLTERHKDYTPGEICCLCGKAANYLKSHLAEHLRRLALFSVPRIHFTSDHYDGSDGAGSHEMGLNFPEDYSEDSDSELSDCSTASMQNSDDSNKQETIETLQSWWSRKLLTLWRLKVQAPFEPLLYSELGDSQPRGDLNTALRLAAKNGRTYNFNSLLRKGADVNGKDSEGLSALMLASQNGHAVVVRALLACPNIDVNQRDNHGETSLLHALKNKHEGIAEILLDSKNIQPHACSVAGHTELDYAAANNYIDIVRKLLATESVKRCIQKEGIKIPFVFACESNHIRIVYILLRLVLEKNPDLLDPDNTNSKWENELQELAEQQNWPVSNFHLRLQLLRKAFRSRKKFFINMARLGYVSTFTILQPPFHRLGLTSPDHNDALLAAASGGYYEIVKILMNYNIVDPNARDARGRTAIMCAASAGHSGLVEYFVERYWHFDARLTDKMDMTALLHAVRSGDVRTIEALMACSDVNAQDKFGNSALIYATKQDRYHIIATILKSKDTDINIKDGDGFSPLLHASMRAYSEALELLVQDSRINLNSVDTDGRSALMHAAISGHTNIVQALLKTNIDKNLKDRTGCFALISAFQAGHFDIVETLINSSGVDLELKDGRGRSLLLTAAEKGSLRTVELLISKGVDVNSSDNNGITALLLARANDHFHVVDRLLATGSPAPDEL